MFSRTRLALVVSLLLTLTVFTTGFAKGNFSFITVTGPTLKEAIRLTDPVLLSDFFFSQHTVEAPADPGTGYEITRYLVGEEAFDKLHYYPDAGFVYYDGIINGSSGEDGTWYAVSPNIKPIFETALSTQTRLVALGTAEAAKALVPSVESQTAIQKATGRFPFTRTQTVIFTIAMFGLIAIPGFAFLRSRKISYH